MSQPASFLSDYRALDVTEGRDTKTLQLLDPLTIYSKVLTDIVTVPAGFIFDGESIPALFHWLVPPFGLSKRGACIHDYLYRNGGYHENRTLTFIPVTRQQADNVYRELVELKGLPKWRATWRYYTLRAVGWWAWNDQPK